MLTPEELQKNQIAWRLDPYKFAVEAMGFDPVDYDSEYKISNQQYELLRTLQRLVWAKEYLRKHIEIKSWDEMSKLLKTAKKMQDKAVSDLIRYMQMKGISVRSGKSCGKDCAVDGIIIPWSLICFEPVKTICLAPSESQLKHVMWREVSKWLDEVDEKGEYRCKVRDFIEMTQESIYFKNPFSGKREKNRIAFAKTVSLEEGNLVKTIDGFHEKNMFVIINESSKVEDEICEQVENTTSDPMNIIICIFNPTKRRGFAYQTQKGEKKNIYAGLHWDFEKSNRMSELAKQNHLKSMEIQYGGRDTDGYRIYVKGEFPTDQSGSYIPWLFVEDAEEKPPFEYPEGHPIKAGIDVGVDKDNTVITYFQGRNMIDIDIIKPEDHGKDEDVLADEVASKLIINNVRVASVEGDGPGKSFAVILRKKLARTKIIILTVKVSVKPTSDEFYQKRDELWGDVRKQFRQGQLKIFPGPNTERLKLELTSFTRIDTDFYKGRIKIEGNHKVGEKLGKGSSPDLASSFIMGATTKDNMIKPHDKYARPRRKRRYLNSDFMGY